MFVLCLTDNITKSVYLADDTIAFDIRPPDKIKMFVFWLPVDTTFSDICHTENMTAFDVWLPYNITAFYICLPDNLERLKLQMYNLWRNELHVLNVASPADWVDFSTYQQIFRALPGRNARV
jgi:hypothetical protein